MKRQKNNNRVIKIVVPVIICLVAALVVAGYFLFRVNNISYEGNRHYSDEEMNNYIFGTDTPNAVVYNIFGKKNKQIPFHNNCHFCFSAKVMPFGILCKGISLQANRRIPIIAALRISHFLQ